MSYDIILQKIVEGECPACSPQEAKACIELVYSETKNRPTQYENVVLELKDGSLLEMNGWADENDIVSCSFSIRDISNEVFEFIYKMADAGKFVIIDCQASDTPDSPIAIGLSEDIFEQAGEDAFRHPQVCSNPKQLSVLLGVTLDKWAELRDKALSDRTNSNLPVVKKKSFLRKLFS